MVEHLPRLYQRSVMLISQYWHGELDKETFIKDFHRLENRIHHEVSVKNWQQKKRLSNRQTAEAFSQNN
ncbi:hypothetical protein [Streptococcus himalayensis]|uniref:Uncharacterized protein n=1 Tax=Streptococcus himalayensis TaxID=1888195 RepID=A0A917A8Q5_9STRE|nr:hypothetical protein [Streptococcus himalayensis]GGE34597.1 hypothetical protein GCM10011510_14900 [Streptococcus himalayensis]